MHPSQLPFAHMMVPGIAAVEGVEAGPARHQPSNQSLPIPVERVEPSVEDYLETSAIEEEEEEEDVGDEEEDVDQDGDEIVWAR